MGKGCILKTVILCKIIKVDYIKVVDCRYGGCALSDVKYFVIYIILNIM